MVSIKILESIGITELSLDSYVMFNKIEIFDENVIILDETLYDDLLLKSIDEEEVFKKIVEQIKNDNLYNLYMFFYCILFANLDDALKYAVKIKDIYLEANNLYKIITNKNIDDDDFLSDLPELVGIRTNLLECINNKRYRLCDNVFDVLFYYDDSLYLRVLKKLCSKKEDNLEYIVSPTVYRDPIVLDNYYGFERKLWFYIKSGLIKEAFEYNKELKKLYSDQNTFIFDLFHVFLIRIKLLMKNKRMISSRKELGVLGDTYSVIFALLNANDFYRVREVIKHEVKENEMRIAYIILNSLSDIMKIYLDKNKYYIENEIEINTYGTNKPEEVIGKYELSSISYDMLYEFEKLNDVETTEQGDLNYYEIYQMLLMENDYRGALSAIKKFEYNMNKLGVKVNYDYIEKDLNLRIANSLGINGNLYEDFVSLGNNAFNQKKYQESITYFEEALNYSVFINPVILTMIGRCYYYSGDINNSIIYYRDAFQIFMYPSDMLDFIDVLYQLEDFGTLLKVSEKYEEYYPLENARLHYIKSIAFLHLKKYDAALKEITYTEDITKEIYEVDYEYKCEKDIIIKCKNGKEVRIYSIDDYIDFNFTLEERQIRNRINNLKSISKDFVALLLEDVKNNDNYEDVIKYLKIIIKVLISDNNLNDAKIVYNYTIEYINNLKVLNNKKDEFTLSLKNYRNL